MQFVPNNHSHQPLLKRIQYRTIYSEPFQTSMMEHFAKIFNDFTPLTIFAKRSIIEV